MHYALHMDKLTAGLKANLLQHLLRSTQGGGTLRSGSDTASAVGSSARSDTASVSQLLAANLQSPANPAARINLPPALRQLLTEHAQLHQLLPQLRSMQSQLSQSAPLPPGSASTGTNPQLLSKLLPLLTQQLAMSGQQVTSSQVRSFVSQWFAFHPAQALTTPPPAQSTSWPGQLGPLLQWLLVQRSASQPLANLLQQSTQGLNTNPPAGGAPASALMSLGTLLLGSMQDIRLSQVHLADTNAQQQPEYYLVLPYQVGDKDHVLECLLRKQARAAQSESAEVWTFSLRFETERYGPMLVKGAYSADKANGSQPMTQLRFYLAGDEQHADNKLGFEQALVNFIERLDKAGLTNVKHEVHLGVVPTTLAPTAHELVKTQATTRGPYG